MSGALISMLGERGKVKRLENRLRDGNNILFVLYLG